MIVKPNILFFTIDSFRADKFYGINKSSITPHIDSLIKNGTYFTQAICSADGTTLSLNSLFSGLYPFEIGTRSKKLLLKDNNYIQILKDNGYHVYGFVPDLTSFSSFLMYCENTDNVFNAIQPVEGVSESLGGKIIAKLESKIQEPWFYYIHLLDLHWPPLVPKEFNSEKFGTSPYEKAVSAIDFLLGKILEKINLETTLIVLTADHGALIPFNNKYFTDFEPNLDLGLSLGKRLMPKSTHKYGAKLFISLRNMIREIRTKIANRNLTPYEKRSRVPYFTLSLHDETIRVPLLFAGYHIPSKIISEQVRSIDIFPTIVEIIGLPKISGYIHGRSLFPILEGKKLEELPAYIHTMPYEKISPHDAVGIRTPKYKYFRNEHDPSKNINLYDLEDDPFENNNIEKIHPDIVSNMEEILSEITKSFPSDNHEEISPEEVAQINKELKELGYI